MTLLPSDSVEKFALPSVRDVRSHLPEDSRSRSTVMGVTLFVGSLLLYTLFWIGTVYLPSWPLRVVAALCTGFFIAVLFVVAHDACHQALTAHPTLNRFIGRIAFLPSLHPYAAWEYSHNGLHHGYTNVKTVDPGYAPLTLDEYRAAPTWRRLLERFYRTTFGLMFLYLIEIWWRCEVFPMRARRPKARERAFQLDRATVFAFLGAQFLTICLLAHRTHASVFPLLLVAILIPFFAWNFVSGFLTFQHHTHPRVAWYRDPADWSFFHGQICSVVHVEFPWLVEVVLHNIMQHTAHHVDPRIPLYHLKESQEQLEDSYAAQIVHVEFSWKGFFRNLRACRLFDYTQHRWLDWDGTPTTEPLLEQHLSIAPERLA